VTVYWDPKSKGYRYDFQYLGRRYSSPRGAPTKREAADAEAARRRLLRRVAAGLEVASVETSPRFHDWANHYLAFVTTRQRLRRVDAVVLVLRVVLRFWGAKPARPLKSHEEGPFHDLRLSDPLVDPSWITKFEAWMQARGIAGATRNRYRTALSRLYAVAMLPEFRAQTGVTMNPFRAMLRDTERSRSVTFTVEQLAAVVAAAPPHLRLAIAIAVYAPKLRLGNILSLRWSDVDLHATTITVAEHKTAGVTGLPLVSPISAALLPILTEAKRTSRSVWVIRFRKKPVKTIDTAMEAACTRAGVPYGRRQKGGVTFHSIRHTMATWLARFGYSGALHASLLGHRSEATTRKYTHLAAVDQSDALERLGHVIALPEPVAGPVVGLGNGSRTKPRRARRARTQKPA
jgi:integrase